MTNLHSPVSCIFSRRQSCLYSPSLAAFNNSPEFYLGGNVSPLAPLPLPYKRKFSAGTSSSGNNESLSKFTHYQRITVPLHCGNCRDSVQLRQWTSFGKLKGSIRSEHFFGYVWKERNTRITSGLSVAAAGGQRRGWRKSGDVRCAAHISPPGSPAETGYYRSSETEEELAKRLEEESEFHEREDLINLHLVSSLILEEKKSLSIVFVSLLAGTACTLSMPIFSGRFFETLIGVRTQPLMNLLAKLCAVYVMEPFFTVLFVTNMIQIWEKVMKELRFRVFQRLLIQKVEFFDAHKVGELTSLLSSELGAIKDIVNENVSRDRGFRSFSEVLGTIVILFVLSPQLAPVMTILMLSISGLVALYKRTTMPVFKMHGLSMARINECASETFSAIRTVRSFGGERRQTSMFEKQVIAYQQSGIRLGWLKATNESWTRMVIYVALMALYILGGLKVKRGELAVGRMVSFIGYTFTLTFAMQGLVNTLADLRGAFSAADRINMIIKTGKVDKSLAFGLQLDNSEETLSQQSGAGSSMTAKDESVIDSKDQGTVISRSLKTLAWSGDVSLEDVHFAYPSRPDAEVLKGVTLLLKNSTITALVGSSGAGKSTIVQLLARFYEPKEGRITLAGEDVRKFDKSEWARAVSIVNQEPVLFAMSIGENIAYGAPDRIVTKGEIIQVAKAANAHDFITALPQGYDTLVGERGGLLSGGQRQILLLLLAEKRFLGSLLFSSWKLFGMTKGWPSLQIFIDSLSTFGVSQQRVAIARALLKNAPILILDEATSSLDSLSERLVQDALDGLMKGRTTLVIAHRLSTVQSAHQIAVCGDGKVLEKGTHLQLLGKGGTYANLVNTQRVTIE